MSEHHRPLFIETVSTITVRTPAENHVVQIDASVLYAALHQARNNPMPGALHLNLTPDFTVTLETQHIERAPSGSILWRGGMTAVPGIHGSFAVSGLDSPTAKNIQLAGSVTAKGVSYRILPAGQNHVCIAKCHPAFRAPADVPIKDNSALVLAPNLNSPANAEAEASPLAVIRIKALYPETILQIILSMPGPYPKNTVVTASAFREREIGDDLLHFQYWELDGVRYSDALTIQVTMDKPHKLKAHIGTKARLSSDDIKITLTPNAGKLVFVPPMPKDGYQHGTDVTVFYRNLPEGDSYVLVAWALDGTKTEGYSMWTNIRIGSKPIHLTVDLGLRKHRISAHCVPADIGFLMNFGDEEIWRQGAADNEKLRLSPVNALSLESNSTFVSLAIDGAKISWAKSDEYAHTVKHDTQIVATFQGHESVLPLEINFDPPEAEIEGRCGRITLRTKLGNKEGKVRALKQETLLIRRDAWIAISPRTRGELSYYDHLLDPPRNWELEAWSLGNGDRQQLDAPERYHFQLADDDAPILTLHFKKKIIEPDSS